MRSTPEACAADITVRVPSTLVRVISSGIGRPKAVIGRDMKYVARALHCSGNGLSVQHIPFDDFEVYTVQVDARAAAAHERAHGIARTDQGSHHSRAHETRGTSDERQVLAGHVISFSRGLSISFSCA